MLHSLPPWPPSVLLVQALLSFCIYCTNSASPFLSLFSYNNTNFPSLTGHLLQTAAVSMHFCNNVKSSISKQRVPLHLAPSSQICGYCFESLPSFLFNIFNESLLEIFHRSVNFLLNRNSPGSARSFIILVCRRCSQGENSCRRLPDFADFSTFRDPL